MRIALCGKMRAGKTEAAIRMEQRHGFKIFKFARAIRIITELIEDNRSPGYAAQKVLEYTTLNKKHYEEMRDVIGKIQEVIKGKEKRTVLQEVGSGLRNLFNEDIWVELLRRNTEFINRIKQETNLVIDDLRYANEHTFCKDNDMIIIKINVSKEKQIERINGAKYLNTGMDNMEHETERDVDDMECDYLVDGNVPLDEYQREIDKIIHELWQKENYRVTF